MKQLLTNPQFSIMIMVHLPVDYEELNSYINLFNEYNITWSLIASNKNDVIFYLKTTSGNSQMLIIYLGIQEIIWISSKNIFIMILKIL